MGTRIHQIRTILSTYAQVLFVVFAFVLMVSLSYNFVSDIEYSHLKNDANVALTHVQANINTDLKEAETTLNNISETIRIMIIRDYNLGEVKNYMEDIAENAVKNKELLQHAKNIYAIFDVFDGAFIASKERNFPEGYDHTASRWYKAAANAGREITALEPYYDSLQSAVIVTYSRRIFDNSGKPLGIVCLDIKLEEISKYIINSEFNSGFGLLLNNKLEIMAHPNNEYVGKLLTEMNTAIAGFAGDLIQGTEIFEREILNYRDEESVVFFKRMDNGWYLGIVVLENKYYKGISKIAQYLTILGLILTVILSFILIRIIKAGKKKEQEIQSKNLKLKGLSHWYSSVLDIVPFYISVQDVDMKMTFINAAAENFLNKKREDILGLPCCDVWNICICKTDKCAIDCARRGKMQTNFLHNKSSYLVDTKVLRDLDGKVSGYVEVIQDITEIEKAAKTEAESANKAKSAFLAKMSHEIRTPMNAIMGVAEIQIQDDNYDAKTKESFVMIYNSSNLLLGIINNILDLSKIEAGKMELASAKYEIGSLISDVMQLNTIRNDNRHIKFELRVDENVPSEFIGDEIRIKQILNNLLSNAFKYTEKGKVELSVFATEGKALGFKVTDTGQGMTKEQLDQLFSGEYTRFNMKSNRLIEGTGLGISIIKYLVQMMNGDISVDSKCGSGTSFTVLLPQENAGTAVLGKETAEHLEKFSMSHQAKKAKILHEPMPYGRVLIVDDVESNLYVAKGLMQPYGLTIEASSGGMDAVEKIMSGKVYDIIFMDHMMPEMDGIEATKKIREWGYTNPIVALTANALVGQSKVFMENGFDDFMSKPIDTRNLNAVLNKFIRDKRFAELSSIFARDAKRVLPSLESVFKSIANATNEDLHLFGINAHAMKSALLNIGKPELSQVALTLETAGKNLDRKIIEQETQKLIDGLKEIVAKCETESTEKFADKDENPEFLKEQLKIISHACENYDERTIDEALNKLKKMSWTKETKDIIDRIAEYILHSDFEEASMLANDYGVSRK